MLIFRSHDQENVNMLFSQKQQDSKFSSFVLNCVLDSFINNLFCFAGSEVEIKPKSGICNLVDAQLKVEAVVIF